MAQPAGRAFWKFLTPQVNTPLLCGSAVPLSGVYLGSSTGEGMGKTVLVFSRNEPLAGTTTGGPQKLRQT